MFHWLRMLLNDQINYLIRQEKNKFYAFLKKKDIVDFETKTMLI